MSTAPTLMVPVLSPPTLLPPTLLPTAPVPLVPTLTTGLLGLAAGPLALVLVRRAVGHPTAGDPTTRPRPARADRFVPPALGLLWALATARLWPLHPPAVPAYLALVLAGLALAVIDARTHLLPDRLTLPAFAVTAAGLATASLLEGDPARFYRGLTAAVCVGAGFLALAVLAPAGMGLGDVKLVPTLALALGWLSWGAVVAGLVAAFLLGGLAAAVALLFLRADRHTALPFGPALTAGAFLALLRAATG